MSHNCSTVAAVAGSASSAEPASIPLTMHLHGHPLPACKPLDIFYRPQEWPHNFKPEDHHRGDDTTLDLFLLSLSRPVLVFAYPAGPGGPMRSAEAAGATKTMSSLAKSKNECEEPSRSIESGVEATLRIIGETLEQLRRQEPHLEVFGMSAATEARRSNAADLGSRLGLTFPLLGDLDLTFGRSLHLPETRHGSTDQTEAEQMVDELVPLMLLFRDGQVVRVEENPVIPPAGPPESALLSRLLAMLQ